MNKEDLKDKDVLLLTAAMLGIIGIFTLSAKKLFSGRSNKPKKHVSLRLPKEFIEKYLGRKGAKIKFEFTEDSGKIKLNFLGFTADNHLCIEKKMDRLRCKEEELENIDFGVFSEDEHHQSLHDILTKQPLRDWFLTPMKCKIKSGYVSYELGDYDPCAAQPRTVFAYKINPCPPGC